MYQLGIIGLGTMGANLARNAARNGATVAVYNRTTEKMEEFMKTHQKEGHFIPCDTLTDLLKALQPPRAILIMVKAGDPVDEVIEELLTLSPITYHLSPEDILIDGGNSHYRDTERREHDLKKKGIHFLGMGVSGGERGALEGPSLMPGGSREAYDHLELLLQKMAASLDYARDDTEHHQKCVAYLGPGGAGHFVKMVHNGIEYGLMQLIAEAYHLLKDIGKKSNAENANIFAEWKSDPHLSSYLLEITSKILRKRDPETQRDLIDSIKDIASQKGTGKWLVEAALTYDVAVPTIAAALDMRIISEQKELRVRRSHEIPFALSVRKGEDFAEDLRTALLLATICTYAQGFDLLERASTEEHWNLRLREIARIWRGGCIIRSALLKTFQDIFAGKNDEKIRLGATFSEAAQKRWRAVVALGAQNGIPLPAFGASLSYFDALRTAHLPSNLIAAQRDFFGAHRYERIDKEGTFHTEWE
ncbi:NADP-dependent phosphogluconate dehydrogenase [Candidatus Peregrinibacteria bacterium]|nr:NADP-dependent phosphogluconate dehydrogenase [Candidatus Peregrinibacteria bacterium]